MVKGGREVVGVIYVFKFTKFLCFAWHGEGPGSMVSLVEGEYLLYVVGQ